MSGQPSGPRRAAGIRAAPLILIALGCASASAIVAQTPSGDGGPPPRPPAEAFAACAAKTEGAACTVQPGGARKLAGECHAPPGRKLACIPAGGPRGPDGPPPGDGAPGGAPPQNDQGPALAGTRVDTQKLLCDRVTKGVNPSVALAFEARWSCGDGTRTLIGNGVPDHAIGAFPNPGNPNRVAPQQVAFSTTLMPEAHAGAGAFVKIAGYALNGIKFDPGTAQSCDSACADHGEGHGNPWRIEALGQGFFAFGVDDSKAHVQPGGAYHYHGVPEAMLSPAARRGQAMALVGWAVDGYPIYARFGHSVAMALSSPLRAMRSSYRLKTRPDAGRPPIGFAPMGTFTQDYEYVAGLGDLDECNGRTDATPEFPNGVYHYYATDGFPFVQRCVKGTPSRVAGEGPPPGGPRFGGRR